MAKCAKMPSTCAATAKRWARLAGVVRLSLTDQGDSDDIRSVGGGGVAGGLGGGLTGGVAGDVDWVSSGGTAAVGEGRAGA